MRNVLDNICRENQNIFLFNKLFPENRAVNEIMWINMIQPDRPQVTTCLGACALYAGYLRLQTHTQDM